MLPTPTAAVAALKPYDPGHDLPLLRRRFAPAPLAELGSNENPLGPSASVLELLRNTRVETLLRYPDPLGASLRAALAASTGSQPAEIMLGNGSHELLMLAAQCFAGAGDEVVFSEFGFAVFPIATATMGATPRRAAALPLAHAMPRGHDLDALLAAIGPRTRLAYLANPNNPTGTWFTQDALAQFLARVPEEVLVVVDEAYHEYVTRPEIGSALALRSRFPNLLVMRTFSKAYGLAGLRLGYAIGDASVIELLNRLRESFNANALALALAEAALADDVHLQHVRAFNAAQVAALAGALEALGLRTHPSQTNFVLVDFGREASGIEGRLLQQGVVVRPMVGYGLPTCLRISAGSDLEQATFLSAMKAALA